MIHQGRDITEGADTVELAFRPTRADILQGIRTRDRIRRLTLLRWALSALFAGLAAHVATDGARSAPGAVLILLCAAVIYGTPRIQANHVFRTVSWQGEFRTTVTDSGVTVETEHTTLVQRWSLFRGYRETGEHMVLLSRDPNILVLEVIPKRGVRGEQDVARLRALLDRHLTRV
ncbi:YcxB family protein [Streptomyces sp. NPDC007808]|uniref:YcxB family protein n=1 Tax=Streptomyces sp. NPDC007808 TaxID=3364779 RepID=UPI0036B8D9C0